MCKYCDFDRHCCKKKKRCHKKKKCIKIIKKIEKPAYAQVSSDLTQCPDNADANRILLNITDLAKNIENVDDGIITVNKSGVYKIILSAQLKREEGCCKPKYIDIWLRKNGADVANSNRRKTLADKKEKGVLKTQVLLKLEKGDFITAMLSVQEVGFGLGIEAILPLNEPLIPSASLLITKIADRKKDCNDDHSDDHSDESYDDPTGGSYL